MKHIITIAAALFMTTCAHAQDSWVSVDKALHAGVSGGIAAVATVATGSELQGFTFAMAVGVAKEVYDKQHPDKHSASYRDLVADAAGAYMGAKLGGVFVAPQKTGGFTVFLSRSF